MARVFRTINVAGIENMDVYEALIYASICKREGFCLDYTLKSFPTVQKFTEWMQENSMNNPKNHIPFIWADDDECIGGKNDLIILYSRMKEGLKTETTLD